MKVLSSTTKFVGGLAHLSAVSVAAVEADPFHKVKKDSQVRRNLRAMQVVAYTDETAWLDDIGGSPSWCANFNAVNGESFQLPNTVLVSAVSSGNPVFNIFQSTGNPTSSNEFSDGKANIFVKKAPDEKTVDIDFIEPVAAWKAVFTSARSGSSTQIKLDLRSTNGFTATKEVTVDTGFFGIISTIDDIEKIRFEALASDPNVVGEEFEIQDVCGSDTVESPGPTSTGGGKKKPSCFSSSNTVEVQGKKGFVSMDSLKIGDYVRAGKDQFSRVISFLHLDRHIKANFLQIHAKDLKKPLEVSPEHMVYVNGSSWPIRAAQVQVGDMLGKNKVLKVTSIKRRGVYAPLTESGDILVNGVLASCYAAVHSHTPVNQHWEAHAFFSLHRLVCAVNFRVCQSETYTNGYPDWMSPMIHFALSTGENAILQAGASIVGLPLITVAYILEQLMYSPILIVAIIVGFFAVKRKTKSKAKIL